MRAITIDDFSAAPAVTEQPEPRPGKGEVLVRVHTSSINGFDLAVTAGMLRGTMEHRFPVILGKDFAGTVEALGEGATRFAVGDRVFGVVMKPFLHDGGLADYVVVSEDYGIAPVPEGLDLGTAGALGLAGAAALSAVDSVAPHPGETVLIAGATGGVGGLAVQLVAATGATVIATAKPGAQAEFVRDLGAAHTVDYTGDLAPQVRALVPQRVAAVLHLAGDGARVADLLAPGGRLASTLGFGPDQLDGRDATATAVMANPSPAVLDHLAADAASGALRVPVTRTYSLAEAPQAIADFRAGVLGKLAVTLV